MTPTVYSDAMRDEAVAWFVRLQECDDETVWLEHQNWLEADPAHAAAYSAVERLWIESDDLPQLEAAEPAAEVIDLSARRAARFGRYRYWLPAAAAAAMVGAVSLQFERGSGETYRTGADATRVVALADGSRIVLNRNTEVTVHLARNRRAAELASGEAAFDIRHEADRPFVVAAGGREIRVLGTEFDVLNDAGAFGVTVRRGLVAVSGTGGTAAARLPAGTALLRPPGARSDTVSRANPDDAFAWTHGQLVYADRPLDAVARDLARYGGGTVSVDPALRDTRVTGVIRIGDPATLDRQLEQLLPIRIEQHNGQRAIVPARH